MNHGKTEKIGIIEKGAEKMTGKNNSIRCTVQQCQYHSGQEQFCSLNSITVGTHEKTPTMMECTDCQSFKLK
jgi:hypothetical protein